MNDYRARKAAMMRRSRESIMPIPSTVASPDTSAAGSPVGERQGRQPARPLIKKVRGHRIVEGTPCSVCGKPTPYLAPGMSLVHPECRDEVSQPKAEAPDPDEDEPAAPRKPGKALTAEEQEAVDWYLRKMHPDWFPKD